MGQNLQSRVLGIDVGEVRVGTALSDPLGLTAQPLEVIQRQKQDPFRRIAELVIEHDVHTIVVGRPLTLSGGESHAVKKTENFVKKLKGRLKSVGKEDIHLKWWDERLSTAQAEKTLIAGGARRNKRKSVIDKVAAAIILQSYLEAHT